MPPPSPLAPFAPLPLVAVSPSPPPRVSVQAHPCPTGLHPEGRGTVTGQREAGTATRCKRLRPLAPRYGHTAVMFVLEARKQTAAPGSSGTQPPARPSC